jgi:hypothetical protein
MLSNLLRQQVPLEDTKYKCDAADLRVWKEVAEMLSALVYLPGRLGSRHLDWSGNSPSRLVVPLPNMGNHAGGNAVPNCQYELWLAVEV